MSPLLDPDKCNRSQLGALLGVELTTIDGWRKKGLPFHQVGRSVFFSVADVVDWRVKQAVRKVVAEQGDTPPPKSGVMLDLVQEQARLASAKADDQERKNRVANNELVNVEEAAAMFEPFGREIRQRLMSLGSKIGPKVGKSVAEQRRLKAAIDEETHKALKALNEYEEEDTE